LLACCTLHRELSEEQSSQPKAPVELKTRTLLDRELAMESVPAAAAVRCCCSLSGVFCLLLSVRLPAAAAVCLVCFACCCCLSICLLLLSVCLVCFACCCCPSVTAVCLLLLLVLCLPAATVSLPCPLLSADFLLLPPFPPSHASIPPLFPLLPLLPLSPGDSRSRFRVPFIHAIVDSRCWTHSCRHLVAQSPTLTPRHPSPTMRWGCTDACQTMHTWARAHAHPLYW
jgi:hypothetical protein